MADGTSSLLWLLLLSSSSLSFGSELDIQCLMNVQQSVIDTKHILISTWTWNNVNLTDSDICRFTGVECGHTNENRVLSLRLSNFGLEGPFPHGLQNCTNMVHLDLSNNKFSGPIPFDISEQTSFLTSLDLSYNRFSGEIPVSMSNMTYLNNINLEHNLLSGQIPSQFSVLSRLTSFSVVDNLLSGPIPKFTYNFPASTFANNQGLCGAPLDPCPRRRRPFKIRLHRLNDASCIGGAVGFITGFVVAFYFPQWFVFSERFRTYCLSGLTPSDISHQMPYLTYLNLSYNIFSGEIPVSISKMTNLNVLHLEHNKFRGHIPLQLSALTRLTSFSVAHNLLSGPIPYILKHFPASILVDNQDLCGAPLDLCPSRRWIPFRIRPHRINDASCIGGAVGFITGFVMAFYFPHWFVFSEKFRSYYLFRVC